MGEVGHVLFIFVLSFYLITHGVKGELRILPTTDDSSRFKKLKKVFVEQNELTEYEIETIRFHKNFVLLKFKGVDDMTSAERLKNAILKINREDCLPLEEDEYYISDLYGMTVQKSDGEILGVLDDILFTAANDVYVVKNNDTGKELLIPAIAQCILKVDVANRLMSVNLLEGLGE
ncbi:MAG: 16S rRNA processing protein RimM [Epulopiscium sp. Nele67-Bin005]|nr:MAG: 16S rRNA processing protein RimM [Epulopiscium sp. Nele67-Bin005]